MTKKQKDCDYVDVCKQDSAIIVTVCMIGFIACIGIAKVYKLSSQPEPVAEVAPTTLPAQLMNVSAYCPCEKCCGKFADGFTASGVPAAGKIAAAPRDVPFGTVLDVPGYGRASVQDRGGAITGNKIDVLFPTHQEALEWGRQYLMVTEVAQ